MAYDDILKEIEAAPTLTPYKRRAPVSMPKREAPPVMPEVEQPADQKPSTFFFKTQAPPPPKPEPAPQSSPLMQDVETEYTRHRFPEMQRPLPPEAAQKIRANFGGNDDLALKNLYGKDPKFRAEVDRYMNGDMSSLSQEAQNHFPSYIINSHYFNDPSAELPANMDITKDPTRKGETWAQWGWHALASVPTIVVGGAADEAQWLSKAFMSTEEFQKRRNDPRWSESVQQFLDPNYSMENTIQTAATQLQIGAALFGGGPASYAIAGLAGGMRDVAAARQRGDDPTLTQAGAGAVKGLASQAIGERLAPAVGSTSFLKANPASIPGRIFNAGRTGGVVGPAIIGASGAVDVAMGTKTPGEALKETAMAAPLGFLTGAGLQTAIETPNIARAATTSLSKFSKTPAAKQYELAVKHGGEQAKTAMAKGLAPEDAVTLQGASPQERGVYQQIHAVSRDLLNPRSTSNIEHPQGALGIDKLKEVIVAQDAAGKALGNIRGKFSSKVKLDVNPARNSFTQFLSSIGITTTGNKLGVENSVLEGPATNALKLAWSKLPASGQASQQQVDDVIQAINQIIQNTDIDESAARAGLGALKQNLRDTLSNSLSDDVKPEYLQATAEYARMSEILREGKKALPFTGRQGAQYSLHQFKEDVLSGKLDLRMGQLVRGLANRSEGMRSPFFNALEEATDPQVYQTQPDKTQVLVPNTKVSPYVQKKFDAKLQTVAKYTARLEQMLGLQKVGSLPGEIKGATGNADLPGSTPKGILKYLWSKMGRTPIDVFNAQDDYLNALQQGNFTPVADPAAASRDLMNGTRARRQQMLDALKDLTDEELAALTPEERAAGIIGGSDSIARSTGIAGQPAPQAPGQQQAGFPSMTSVAEALPATTARFPGAAGTPLAEIPNTQGFVYHATTPERAAAILKGGLQPVDGKVFLAPSPDIAKAAVSATDAAPVVLKIPVSAIKTAFSDPNVTAGVPTFYTDQSITAKFLSRLTQ